MSGSQGLVLYIVTLSMFHCQVTLPSPLSVEWRSMLLSWRKKYLLYDKYGLPKQAAGDLQLKAGARSGDWDTVGVQMLVRAEGGRACRSNDCLVCDPPDYSGCMQATQGIAKGAQTGCCVQAAPELARAVQQAAGCVGFWFLCWETCQTKAAGWQKSLLWAHGPWWKLQEALPPTVCLHNPLWRKPNIVFTLKEKCLKEFYYP